MNPIGRHSMADFQQALPGGVKDPELLLQEGCIAGNLGVIGCIVRTTLLVIACIAVIENFSSANVMGGFAIAAGAVTIAASMMDKCNSLTPNSMKPNCYFMTFTALMGLTLIILGTCSCINVLDTHQVGLGIIATLIIGNVLSQYCKPSDRMVNATITALRGERV